MNLRLTKNGRDLFIVNDTSKTLDKKEISKFIAEIINLAPKTYNKDDLVEAFWDAYELIYGVDN